MTTLETPGPASARAVDPVLAEVVRHGLTSSAELMRTTLCRTAFSPIIYEVSDFCCALYDREVRLLAQARSLPLWLGTMDYVIRACLEAIGGEQELRDGDAIVHTGAYETGSHAQDLAVVVPVFLDGRLVGYSTTKAHQLDLGAKHPYCTDTTDLFQEGVIFPGVRLYRAGVLQDDIHRTLLANSRAPASLQGDLDAEVGACRVGAVALAGLIAKHGLEDFDACTEVMFDRGEAAMRRAVAEVPDGDYVGENCFDDDGIRMGVPVPMRVSLRVAGSDVTVDVTDSPPEALGPLNCPRPTTVSAARFAVVSALARRESVNEGHFRPIHLETTEGTLFHPRSPAPIFLYFVAGMLIIDAIHRALAEVVPGAIAAGSGGDLNGLIAWKVDPLTGFSVSAADHTTGQGASAAGDGGAPLMHISCSGGRNTPVEVWESSFPHLLVERQELVTDSPGPGRHRGGPALELHYRALGAFSATVGVERSVLPPWGLAGGGSGLANAVAVRGADGSLLASGKTTDVEIPQGALITYRLGAGGGWGPPEQRDPQAVHADVRDGYLSPEQARRAYPHAFEEATA